jgi:tRNA pseudouridine55 synthase
VLAELVRLRSGSFTIEAAITLDELADAVQTDRVAQHLFPIEAALGALVRVPVDDSSSARLLNGRPIAGPAASEECPGYAVEPNGAVRAILAYDSAAGLWRPKKVFPPVP